MHFRLLKRGEDTTVEEFKVYLIDMLETVIKQMQKQQLPVEANVTYQDLWKITEDVRRDDLKSPWPRGFKMDEVINSYVKGKNHSELSFLHVIAKF